MMRSGLGSFFALARYVIARKPDRRKNVSTNRSSCRISIPSGDFGICNGTNYSLLFQYFHQISIKNKNYKFGPDSCPKGSNK